MPNWTNDLKETMLNWPVVSILLATALLLVGLLLIWMGVLKEIRLNGIYVDLIPFRDFLRGRKNIWKWGGNELFSNTDDPRFIKMFESLAPGAKKIVLIGTGLNIIDHNKKLFFDLVDETIDHCCWEIYAANPYSPAIEDRLIEEKTGPRQPVAKDKLIDRLNQLLEKKQTLPSKAKDNFVVRLFSHYPTLSMFIIDDDYFYYPYGFRLLGDFSPVTRYSGREPRENPMIEFLKKQYVSIESRALDAELIFDIYEKQSLSDLERKLLPFAVYIIPEAGSDLYRFGTSILGYDIRKNCLTKTQEFKEYSGQASYFGFHLTVADALYFTDTYEIELLHKEIESLVKEFQPFDLQFELKEGFPDDRSISLVCIDESGTLEALHFEFVHRFYRRAVASNYSKIFGERKAKINRNYARNPVRSEKMIKLYKAPYILQYFKPHFSLLTDVPPKKMKDVSQKLRSRLPESPVRIGSLCLMTRQENKLYWEIKEGGELDFSS